jgi:signal transduction histidine kinase
VTGDPRRGDFDRYYATVTGEILRLEHLVGAFLDLSRSEAMSRGPVDLGRSVATAVALFEPDAEDRGVVLSATTSPDLVVDGDAGRLATVWNNLLSNALGAATNGGRIDVRVAPTTDPRGSGAEVVVHDDGEGMSPDELARVWDPFYSEKDGGTGLGLSIVRSVVERHGGTASIESAPGRGTTARVWLPIGPRQGEA